MLTITNVIATLTLCVALSSCVNLNTKEVNNVDNAQWDFDHQVQFIQTTLEERNYQLEMIPNKRVGFGRLSAFLLRKSYVLCGGYHYKVEMIQGIEGFDDKLAMPNYIHPTLIANIDCKVEIDAKLESGL